MKLKVQAQHLQLGDIVGSGEKVVRTYILTDKMSKGKVGVQLIKYQNSDHEFSRCVHWGKYTMINVERK